jgi:hypothetical protein
MFVGTDGKKNSKVVENVTSKYPDQQCCKSFYKLTKMTDSFTSEFVRCVKKSAAS